MPDERKRFYVSPEMQKAIDDRTDDVSPASTVINAMCTRYAEICRRTKIDLSEAELNLIRDSMNGTIMTGRAEDCAYLWHGIEDSVTLDHLDQKWEVDGKAIVEKLKKLTYAENVALVDAVERWWREQSQNN